MSDIAAYPSWSLSLFSPLSYPTLPSLSLSDDEQRLVSALQSQAQNDRADMALANAYYMGSQAMRNLQVAIPDELAQKLRTLVGWARVAVNPYVDRLHVEGWRLPGATSQDELLGRIWSSNGLDSEESLAFTDALTMGRAWWLVGSNPESDVPLITAESPLNVSALWDLSGRRIMALMQTYSSFDTARATLMLPDRTMHLAQDEDKRWVIVDIDQHNFGYVTAVRMAHAPRTDNRNGYSAITPEMMSIIDSACRRLMGLEASSELYSVPRMLILGASADDWQNPDGTARRAWDAYISKISVLENDENGNPPSVVQLTTYDPSVFTKVIEMYAAQFAGEVASLPQELGLYTDGNPISVESVDAMDMTRNRHAKSLQESFEVSLRQVLQMSLRLMNGGALPTKYESFQADWRHLQLVNFPAAANAVAQSVAAGVLPARSDTVRSLLGLNAVQSAQIEKDFGEQVPNDIVAHLQQVASSARGDVTSGSGEAAVAG